MNDDASRKRLGRGLAALIGEMDKPAETAQPQMSGDRVMPIEWIERNAANPRRVFAEAEIEELAQSIREHGIIQPIVVRSKKGAEQAYEIIAGERRWRASQRAGLVEVPVIIREVDDKGALELAIIENVQRADLNPIEEGLGYQQLMDEHGYTQADLGDVIGKSRSHVANTLRLLKLPAKVQALVSDGALSAGHARTLVTAEDPAAIAELIVRDGLSVREAERLAQQGTGKTSTGGSNSLVGKKDADTLALEKALTDAIGCKVEITHGEKGGDVRIRYKTLDQLDAICRMLSPN